MIVVAQVGVRHATLQYSCLSQLPTLRSRAGRACAERSIGCKFGIASACSGAAVGDLRKGWETESQRRPAVRLEARCRAIWGAGAATRESPSLRLRGDVMRHLRSKPTRAVRWKLIVGDVVHPSRRPAASEVPGHSIQGGRCGAPASRRRQHCAVTRLVRADVAHMAAGSADLGRGKV